MSTRLILRRLRTAFARDNGVTLAELVVGMGLSTLVGALTLTLVLNIDSSSGATTDRTINSSSARNAIQAWTAYLRVADGTTAGSRTNRIEWLSANDMLFYADLYNRTMSQVGTTGAPTMIWLRLDAAGSLVEEQFASTAAAGAAPKTCRVLVSNVITAPRLFTGWDATPAEMSSQDLGAAPTASTGCRPLPVTVPSQTKKPDLVAQTNLRNVNSVVIDFVVRDTKGAHPLEFKSQAVLPSLGGV